MNSLRSQLPDPESILLLYAAGELPDSDREAVEQELAADPALADRLASIRQMLDETGAAFASIDSAATGSTNGASARASNAIRHWQAARQVQRAAKPPAVVKRFEWSRPAAAAAAVLLIAAGVFALKHWPQKGANQQAGSREERRGLPGFGDPEERAFNYNALDELARGGNGPELGVIDPVTEQPQVMPPSATEVIASAAAGSDQPFFDVPLAPDVEPLP